MQVWLYSSALLLLLYLPFLLLGDQAYIRIHDTLEGEWLWYKIVADSGQAFNFGQDAQVNQVMHGLPRQVFPSSLNILYLLQHFPGSVLGLPGKFYTRSHDWFYRHVALAASVYNS